MILNPETDYDINERSITSDKWRATTRKRILACLIFVHFELGSKYNKSLIDIWEITFPFYTIGIKSKNIS